MEAAERFARGEESAAIARDLRGTARSVQRWRKAWNEQGPTSLVSQGPASLPLLSDELFAVLETELDKGPVAHGRPDRTWALSRIKTLIGRRLKARSVRVVSAVASRSMRRPRMTARTSVASSGRPTLRRPSTSGPSQSVVAVRRKPGHNCRTALSRSWPNICR
ncbi:helix-turn-helix domain-containing protein [Streptomyces chrestomyceticus]